MEKEHKYKLHDEIYMRNDSSRIGTIVELADIYGPDYFYIVSFSGKRRRVREIDILLYVSNARPIDILLKGELGNHTEFQMNMLYQKISEMKSLTNTIYSYNTSRTIFFPYQFKPLLKILRSGLNRILIADEVGLGKTIEAGIIFSELKARHSLKKTLVICPSVLKQKWQLEFKTRFNEEFVIVKNAKEFCDNLTEWSSRKIYSDLKFIVSLESIRSDIVIAKIKEYSPEFDLIIIDEAHHLKNASTGQYRVCRELCNSADAVLMLTATPIQIKQEDLFNLLHILDGENFPDLYVAQRLFSDNVPVVNAQNYIGRDPVDFKKVTERLEEAERRLKYQGKDYLVTLCRESINRVNELESITSANPDYKRKLVSVQKNISELNIMGHVFTRTRKKEVAENTVTRKAHPVLVEMNEIETKICSIVIEKIRRDIKAKSSNPLIQTWMLCTPLRRLGSSIPAMLGSIQKKRIERSREQEYEELSELEVDDEQVGDTERNIDAEVQKLLGVENIQFEDSKYLKFSKIIGEIKRKNKEKKQNTKIMVFAFFKDTLYYLLEKLKVDEYKVLILTGDIPGRERLYIIEKFKTDDSVEIMLSSRVGSEGLDFQFCNTIVNYDLPWNPMEIEQRIGRLDRIGQQSKVINIYNMFTQGTIEEKIIKRLYDRIGIFEDYIGDLEPIVGEIRGLIERILVSDLTPEEENKLIKQSELAIERNIADREVLEAESKQFVGFDSVFDEEIKRIQSSRLYVTEKEIQSYLFYFLETECAGTRYEYDEKRHLGEITPNSSFYEKIAGIKATQYYGEKINFTFNSSYAFHNQNIEFINNNNALIETIKDYQSKYMGKYNNAYYVVLETDKVAKGIYLYYVGKVIIKALKASNTLETVFVDTDLNEIGDKYLSEGLLADIVEKGENSKSKSFNINENIRKLYDSASRYFIKRSHLMLDEVKNSNRIAIESRIASLKISHLRKLQRLQENHQKHEASKNEAQVKGIRTRINNLEHKLIEKIKGLDNLMEVTCETEEICIGILEVV